MWGKIDNGWQTMDNGRKTIVRRLSSIVSPNGKFAALNPMKSLFSGKIWIILLAFFALGGLIVLTSGLSGMEFDQPFIPGMERGENPFALTDTDANGSLWMRYIVTGLLLVMFLLALGKPVRPQKETSLIALLVRTLAFIAFFVFVFGRMAENGFFLNEEELPPMPEAGLPSVPTEIEPFAQPTLSFGWVFWVTAFIVIVLTVILFYYLNRSIDRWFDSKQDLQEIADIVRTTLNDLSSETVTKNTIIRCYVDMNAAVDRHRGIAREAAMTPAEFAGYLENAGLPGDAVNGLTHVFERVRYGGQSVSSQEIKEAKRCLTSILRAVEAK